MEAWIANGEIYVKPTPADRQRLKRHYRDDMIPFYVDGIDGTLSTLPPGDTVSKWKEILSDAWNDAVANIDAKLPQIKRRWTSKNTKRLNAAIGRGDCERILYVVENLGLLHFHVYEWGGISLWWILDRPDRIDGLIGAIEKALREREEEDVF